MGGTWGSGEASWASGTSDWSLLPPCLSQPLFCLNPAVFGDFGADLPEPHPEKIKNIANQHQEDLKRVFGLPAPLAGGWPRALPAKLTRF